MSTVKVKVKKLNENAVIPQYATPGAACVDLVATSVKRDEYMNYVFGTGLAFEIPKGYVGRLYPRSSNSKTNLYLTNSVGNIDSDYRGEVMVKFKARDVEMFPYEYYKVGDRICQMSIEEVPEVEFEEVSELSETERGAGGFGSTGR